MHLSPETLKKKGGVQIDGRLNTKNMTKSLSPCNYPPGTSCLAIRLIFIIEIYSGRGLCVELSCPLVIHFSNGWLTEKEILYDLINIIYTYPVFIDEEIVLKLLK